MTDKLEKSVVECNLNMKTDSSKSDELKDKEDAKFVAKKESENKDDQSSVDKNLDPIEEKPHTVEEKLAFAKNLFNLGSRNYLVKDYSEAADQLSQVCETYEEINGPTCPELGMPYLLYAKSLIALALEENKVLDVPDEADDADDDDDDDDAAAANNDTKGKEKVSKETHSENGSVVKDHNGKKMADENVPSSSKGIMEDSNEDENDDNENASNLQIAWEILESAARIFAEQGVEALPNLAEVHAELGNVEFENNILDSAREDYGQALKIYKDLEISVYRRAMAEVHYKIGLTYLLQQYSPDGIQSFKEACRLLSDEIDAIKKQDNVTEKDKDNIQDMEETKAEIFAKINEIEETRQQITDEVRTALNNFISPVKKSSDNDAGASTSSASNGPKPTDISHLIKRKKPDHPDPEESPAKKSTT